MVASVRKMRERMPCALRYVELMSIFFEKAVDKLILRVASTSENMISLAILDLLQSTFIQITLLAKFLTYIKRIISKRSPGPEAPRTFADKRLVPFPSLASGGTAGP